MRSSRTTTRKSISILNIGFAILSTPRLPSSSFRPLPSLSEFNCTSMTRSWTHELILTSPRQGHLLITIPSVQPHIEVFFRTSTADSPASASPSSASSSTAPPTTAEQQIRAYHSSQIAQQLETVAAPPALPVPPPTLERENSKKRTKKEAVESPGLSSNHSLPTPPLFGNTGFQAQSHSASTFAQSNVFPSPHLGAAQQLPYPFVSNSNFASPQFDLPTDALQALAHAAVPDHEHAMEGVVNASHSVSSLASAGGPGGTSGERPKRLEIPLLPSESIRNQLLDLYFNQVVQPYFPMLVNFLLSHMTTIKGVDA